MSVRQSLGWVFSGQIVGNFISFAGSVVVARMLSPHELGIYTVAVATSGVLGIFVSFGTQTYVVRERDLTPQMLDTAFTTQFLLCIGLSVGLFAASFAGSALYGDPGVSWVLRILAISPLIGVLGFRPLVAMQRAMQFRVPTIINTTAAIINTLAVVLFASFGFSYMSLAFATLISTMFSTAALNVAGYNPHRIKFSLVGWRPMIVFGLRMMSVGGVSVLAQRVSELILSHMLGLVTLALYSRASGISSMIFSNVYGSATSVIFTKLSKDYRERGVLRDAFLPGLDMILSVMWPASIGLAILSRPFIRVVYGEQWLGAALPLALLMGALFFTLSFGMNWELFVLRDETARQTKYEVIRSVLGCLLFSVGCLFNIVAATFGRVLDALVGAIFYFPKMGQLSGATNTELVAIYKAGLLLTGAAVWPSLALMTWSGWDANVSIVAVTLCIMLGGVSWLALLRKLDHILLRELLHIGRAIPFLGPLLRRET